MTNATLSAAGYVTSAALSTYATTAALSNYVSGAALSGYNYATQTWVATNYATKSSFGTMPYKGVYTTGNDKPDSSFTGGIPDLILEQQGFPSGLIMRFGHIENCTDGRTITHKKSGWTSLQSIYNVQITGASNSTNYQDIVVEVINVDSFKIHKINGQHYHSIYFMVVGE